MQVDFDALVSLLIKQLNNNFILKEGENKILEKVTMEVLTKIEYSFIRQKDKYYYNNGQVIFNPFNTVQYTIFLYYMSNLLYDKYNNEDLASRVYFLNKMFTGADLFYAIKLPSVFGAQHPVGAVLGRAKYDDYFFFYQHTTVGGNKGAYPTIGKGVILFYCIAVILFFSSQPSGIVNLRRLW